jgi:heme uptake protein IsdC
VEINFICTINHFFLGKDEGILQWLQNVSKSLTIMLLTVLIFLGIANPTAAAGLADGEYSVTYSVLKADSDSASMADGYFNKPAKLIVKNGVITAQIGLSTSAITEFKVNGKPVTVVSKNGESSTVQFQINNLNNPTNGEIHVIVAEQNYDHWYTIRMSFDENTIKALSTSDTAEKQSSNDSDQTGTTSENVTTTTTGTERNTVENPQTGDSNSLTLYGSLAVLSGTFMLTVFIQNRKRRVVE